MGTRYNPFRYTGSYLDAGTPFYQMGARYYAPGQGRFTQQDPLGSSVLEANRYHYAGCNPSNNVDPTGLFTISAGCLLSLAGLAAQAAVVLGFMSMPFGIFAVTAGWAFGALVAIMGFVDTLMSNPSGLDVAVSVVDLILGLIPVIPFAPFISVATAAYSCIRGAMSG